MTKLFIANWKSNKTVATAEEWLKAFDNSKIPAEAEVVIAPSFSLLLAVSAQLKSPLKFGAQDVSLFPMGSYTGAVNAQQLVDQKVEYVIVGHSERRRYFHETHQDVANKLQQAMLNGLKPILCLDDEYIEAQAAALESTDLPNLVVAYEPVEAIGSGHNAPVDQVQLVTQKIKLAFGDVPVIYGGSVDEQNVHEYLLVSDGVLVGTASLDPVEFAKVVAAAHPKK